MEEGELAAPKMRPVPLAQVQPARLDLGKLTPPSSWRKVEEQSQGREEGVSKSQVALSAPHRELWKGGPSTCRGGRVCWLSLCETTALDTCTELLPRGPGRTGEAHRQGERILASPQHVQPQSPTRDPAPRGDGGPGAPEEPVPDADRGSVRKWSCSPHAPVFHLTFFQQMTIRVSAKARRPWARPRDSAEGTGWLGRHWAPGWEQWAAVWTLPAGAPGTAADAPTSEI